MVDEVDGVGELLEDLKKHTFQKYEAFTVGEVFNMKEGELDAFIGENGHFSTIFDFSAHVLSEGEHGWYDAPPVDFKEWRKAITDSQLRPRIPQVLRCSEQSVFFSVEFLLSIRVRKSVCKMQSGTLLTNIMTSIP